MSSGPGTRDRLDSWKEIAEYVGRDVRTAIRWERRGLPVHRVPGGRRSAVFAYRAEIDEWLRGEGASADHVAHAAPPPPESARRSDAAPPTSARPAGAVGGARRVRWPGSVAAGLAILVLGALGARTWTARPPRVGSSASTLAKLEYSPREIVGRAEDGTVLWRFTPPAAIETAVLDGATMPWYDIADLDGDGRPDAVATVPLRQGDPMPGQNLARDELFCLASDGRVLWQTRLEDVVRFRAGSFGPAWLGGRVAVFRVKDGWRIAWSQVHHTWWPSPLVVFDASGRRLSTFVHAGSIRSLRVVEIGGRPVVLAAGVSNAHRAAFLAVLDAEAVRGQGPVPPGSPFECLTCDEALPQRYFVFPPSDISEAAGLPYNFVSRILSFPPAIEVFTREDGNESPHAEMNFRFSTDFELLDARASDSFRAHEFYERVGKLDHPAARCPWYLHPPPVREWTPAGWRDLTPSTRR